MSSLCWYKPFSSGKVCPTWQGDSTMEFNETKSGQAESEAEYDDQRTENFEGGEAFEPQSAKLALYKRVANNLLEENSSFYDAEVLRPVVEEFEAIAEEDPEFALKLAGYAQQELGLRDISTLLLVLAANHERTVQPDNPGVSWVRDYSPTVLVRPDDLTTAVAMQDNLPDELPARLDWFNSSLPSGLRKGMEDTLHNFDKYQFAKYDSDRREYNLRDVVNRVHPTPQDADHERIFESLMHGDLDKYEDVEPLESPETWEVIVTKEVEEAIPDELTEAKRDWLDQNRDEVELLYGEDASPSLSQAIRAWEQVSNSHETGVFGTEYTVEDIEAIRDDARERGFREALDRMGLFAKIRNIRNMLEVGIDGEDIFGDESMDHVRNSMFFPFRFYQAYKAYEQADLRDEFVEAWLSDAMDETVSNVPDAWENTFVAVDVSKSMRGTYTSQRSNMDAAEISTFFGAVLDQAGADTAVFGTEMKEMRFHHGTPTVERQKEMLDAMERVGGATNAWKVLAHLNEADREYDRIVFLTDMQAWQSERFLGGRRVGLRSEDDEKEIEPDTVKEWYDTYRDETNRDVGLYMLDLSSYGDLVTPEGYENVFNVNGWNSEILEFVEHAEQPGDAVRMVEEFEP